MRPASASRMESEDAALSPAAARAVLGPSLAHGCFCYICIFAVKILRSPHVAYDPFTFRGLPSRLGIIHLRQS